MQHELTEHVTAVSKRRLWLYPEPHPETGSACRHCALCYDKVPDNTQDCGLAVCRNGFFITAEEAMIYRLEGKLP